MECLRPTTVTRSTFLEKSVFQIIRWISSTCEVGGSRGLDETSSREVERAVSKPSEVQVVQPQEEPADLQTTPSEGTGELREPITDPPTPEPVW